MKETGVTILPREDGYLIQAVGRANFDYAVPLRDLSKDLSGREKLCFDLSGCTAMDSTFMGVMSMIGLKARRCGETVEIAGAADHLRFLLRGLGVEKLFRFVPALPASENDADAPRAVSGDRRATAETVLEAHQTLVEADAANAAKFETVIQFAREDVDRLKSEQ